MISTIPKLTDAGRALLLRAIAGDRLTFTRMAIGSGTLADGQNQDELNGLICEELSIVPMEMDTSQNGLISITGCFDSEDVTHDFAWREFGVFAKGEFDGIERLYAYANDGDRAGTLCALDTQILTEQTLTLIVEVGDAKSVTAIYSPHAQYALAETLDYHMKHMGNPHRVNKSQIGLDRVQNATPSEGTIYFTEESESSAPVSGETAGKMMGRIAKSIKDAIAHMSSRENPHGVTKAQVGLGNVENTSPSDGVITFAEESESSAPVSGEAAGKMMGRIAKSIKDAIAHMSSRENPHGVTKAQVGLGNVENTSPSFNIIHFDLPEQNAAPESGETASIQMGKIARSLKSLIAHLSNTDNPHSVDVGQMAVTGTYTGDGIQSREIGIGFAPSVLLLWDEHGRTYNADKGVCGGMATSESGIRIPGSTALEDAQTWNENATALMLTQTGFRVNYKGGATAESSIDTNEIDVMYRYIAFR